MKYSLRFAFLFLSFFIAITCAVGFTCRDTLVREPERGHEPWHLRSSDSFVAEKITDAKGGEINQIELLEDACRAVDGFPWVERSEMIPVGKVKFTCFAKDEESLNLLERMLQQLAVAQGLAVRFTAKLGSVFNTGVARCKTNDAKEIAAFKEACDKIPGTKYYLTKGEEQLCAAMLLIAEHPHGEKKFYYSEFKFNYDQKLAELNML